ncbi:MAG: sulfatase-like hydrolase/transferase [Planctomycetota bacterium]
MKRLLLMILLAASSCGSSEEPGRSTSVLLVTLDTIRTERLGCYGRSNAGTPHLDRLAGSGVLFDQAYTVAPITLPAHASILTGTTPVQHRVRDNRGFRVAGELTTLAEILQDAGFATGAFLGAFPLSAKFGLDQGFDHYDDDWSRSGGTRFEFPERPAEEVVAAATQWIAEQDGPFFAWVHLFDPHEPYLPPPPFDSQYRSDPYQGEVSYLDHCLGRLLDAVGSDVMIVVVGDHGEGLGDHGERNHVSLVYNSTVRVPLILAGPGIPNGKRTVTTVTTVDILPTLTGLLGLETPRDAAGRSLAEAWSGGADDRTAYFETHWPPLQQGWSALEGVVRGRWKLIEAPGASEVELFDIRNDPREQTDVAEQYPKIVRELRSRLEELRSRKPLTASSEQAASPEDIEALRRLGYVQSAAPPAATGAHPKERIGLLTDLASAMAQIEAGRYEAALQTLDRMALAYPGSLGIHEYRSLALLELGRQDPSRLAEAIAELRVVLSHTPNAPLLWRRLADAQHLSGDEKAAALSLMQSLRYDPSSTEVAVQASQLALEAADVALALDVFELVDPGEPDAELDIARGTALAAASRYDEAFARFEQARERASDKTQRLRILNLMGLIHREQEHFEKAIETFEVALDLDPKSQVVRTNLATTYERAGKAPEAKALWQALAKDFPEQPYFRQRFEALR